jgi:type VI secretion system protein ImpE
VSLALVAGLQVHSPERVRDLVWRRAELEVRGGPTGVVYLPALYPTPPATDAQALGRETDWVEADGAVHGVGLRTFLVGDEAAALGDFTELRVNA